MSDRINSLNASQAKQMMEISARRAFTWLQGLRTAEDFQLSTGVGTTLPGTCYATLLLEGLKKLETNSEATRSKWARHLQSFQKADSGIFCRDETYRPNENGSFFPDNDQTIQDTYYTLHALDALGLQAPFSLKFTSDFVQPGKGADPLIGLDWSSPLQQSDRLMYLLAFLVYRFEVEGHFPSADLYYSLLNRLNTTEDPIMGFYGTHDQTHPAVAAAAGARLIPFYEYVHCPILHQGRKIDTLLALPEEVEAYSVEGPVDWDDFLSLTRTLAALSKTENYRSDEIRERLAWSFQVIYDQQMDTGAFPSLEKEQGGENSELTLLNTWLCLSTLAASACALFDDFPLSELWEFRRTPALGYYHPQNGLDERERRVLREWIQTRNLPVGSLDTHVPTVSVVIPCYNLGVYLADAVDSVLAQSWQDFEIIIVDDGSSDEFTCLVLETIRQPKTRLIRQPNRGLAAARNAGILQAQGKFICCLDADDRLVPDYLKRAMAVLDREPETGFVTSFYTGFDESQELVTFPTCGFPELLTENRAMVSALFRKGAWSQVGGYFEGFSLPGFEDWDLWISLVEAGWGCAVIPEVLFEYRVRLNSMYQTVLRTPDKLGAVVTELVNRHPRSYAQYVAEVVGELNAIIVEKDLSIEQERVEKAWLQGQVNNWQAKVQSLERSITELEAWTGTLEQEKQWLEEQAGNWQKQAHELEQSITELEAWTGKLEEGKRWLEEQAGNWQKQTEQRETQILELKSWIDELEQRNHSLEARPDIQQEQRQPEEREGDI